ncbi:unnamed protein product, partial [Prunus brigantina]
MERTFHEHFYQTNREITVAELARMSQATDESPRDYLQRFKTCRNWCRTSLPEREFVKMAEEGLEFEAEAIFDLLLTEKKVKLSFGHKIRKPEELKGKTFCKYHSSWSHNTNNCVVLRDVIQKLIDENKLQFPEKPAMKVDSKPFPPPTINMVNA